MHTAPTKKCGATAHAACALCGGPACPPVTVARPAPVKLTAGVHHVDIAVICRGHLPAMFAALPIQVRLVAVAGVWALIDTHRGQPPAPSRVPTVRSPLPGAALRVRLRHRLRGLRLRAHALRSWIIQPAPVTHAPATAAAPRKEVPTEKPKPR